MEHDQAITQNGSTLRDLARQPTPPLAVMATPPADPAQREEIGQQMWAGIILGFERRLSAADLHRWRNPPGDIGKSVEHLRILRQFDDFLLGQFAEFGWRLLMSSGALQRIAEWEKHNPRLLRRLGEELALRSEVLRGEKSARLVEDIAKFADGAIFELKMLLERQRSEFGSRRGAPSCNRIAGWMKAEIESEPQKYRLLRVALAQLCGWIENLPRLNPDMAVSLLRGQLCASAFFYSWYAACANRSIKDVQNMISRRRAASRKNRK